LATKKKIKIKKLLLWQYVMRTRAGLAMGASRPWPDVMKSMTGQEIMDGSAIREYFKPLEEWLAIKNAQLGEVPGWD
jgi:hypothetical protein